MELLHCNFHSYFISYKSHGQTKNKWDRDIFCLQERHEKNLKGIIVNSVYLTTLIPIVKMFVHRFHTIHICPEFWWTNKHLFWFSLINVSPLYKRLYNPSPKYPYIPTFFSKYYIFYQFLRSSSIILAVIFSYLPSLLANLI